MCGWAPAAMLPVFQILGTDYTKKLFFTKFQDREENMDAFTKVDFVYPSAVATIKVAKGAKAEGELVIAGTEGYIYVPAPWWKTDYFEVRYENQEDNKRFFYQLEGEGIRYEIVAFAKAIESGRNLSYVPEEISTAIAGVIEDFNARKDMIEIE
jgi:choline-phosphate cytidylyltransferase